MNIEQELRQEFAEQVLDEVYRQLEYKETINLDEVLSDVAATWMLKVKYGGASEEDMSDLFDWLEHIIVEFKNLWIEFHGKKNRDNKAGLN